MIGPPTENGPRRLDSSGAARRRYSVSQKTSFVDNGRDHDAGRMAKDNDDTYGETVWWLDFFDHLGSIIIMGETSTGLAQTGLDSFVSTATGSAVRESCSNNQKEQARLRWSAVGP
jgi:hypothetical protein